MELLGLAARIALSLAAVLGLMWMLARASRKGGRGRGRSAGPLEVIARQQLSRNASIAVVRVADRALVIGVTDVGVSLLGEAELAAVEQAADSVIRTRVELPATGLNGAGLGGGLNGTGLNGAGLNGAGLGGGLNGASANGNGLARSGLAALGLADAEDFSKVAPASRVSGPLLSGSAPGTGSVPVNGSGSGTGLVPGTESGTAHNSVSPAGTEPQRVRQPGRFAGSALSPSTWKQTVEFLRERTARRT
jgi:flagellar biosynthetic protein FliO